MLQQQIEASVWRLKRVFEPTSGTSGPQLRIPAPRGASPCARGKSVGLFPIPNDTPRALLHYTMRFSAKRHCGVKGAQKDFFFASAFSIFFPFIVARASARDFGWASRRKFGRIWLLSRFTMERGRVMGGLKLGNAD